ncbi:hypothetical protein DQQ10_24305 [Pseudochryseolinea flava]|uniref:Uncharacterized protein n=1 Tax=Pseudochryseolinea flava TaxID=2059302 RepID=A0A364XXJ5_9BACT|nr:hypothetical protein DQQ10_24305 [Pseudochryseolinea flava]
MTVLAQSTETPVIDQRQKVQRARIRSGAASGELTRRETVKARSDQRRIRRTERRAKADGEMTTEERARIQRKQNKASRSLRRNKQDDQQRPGTN